MQYFASSLTGSSLSLAANLQLVTKVYFPRALLPLAAVIVPMIDFIVGLPVLIFLMWLYGTWPAGPEVLLAPGAMASRSMTALGAGFLLSALNVRYRDVRYMIPVFLQVLPLLSGVMYAVEEIPTKWQWILAFNPMTAVIADWRWAMLDASTPDLGQTAVGVAVALVVFFGGLCDLPLLRAEVRGHDLMADRHRGRRASPSATGSASSRPRTGRFASRCPTSAKRLTGKEHRGGYQEIWALRDVSFELEEGKALGRHRPQRGRQVDAAQDPDPDHDSHRGHAPRSAAASAACSRSEPASTPSSPGGRTSS